MEEVYTDTYMKNDIALKSNGKKILMHLVAAYVCEGPRGLFEIKKKACQVKKKSLQAKEKV